MTHAIVFGGIVALAALLIALFRSWQANGREDPDRVGWPKIIAIIPIAIGAVFAGRATWGLFADRDPHWLIIFVPGAVAIVLFLPALLRSEVFIANGELSGPASLVGPFTWYARNTIPLCEIRSVEGAPYDYTYVESGDGRRVYIANSYRGSAPFIARLNAARAAANAES